MTSQQITAAQTLRYARLALHCAPTDFDRAVARLFLCRAIKDMRATLPPNPTGGMFHRPQI
jgi:hypothetical protein